MRFHLIYICNRCRYYFSNQIIKLRIFVLFLYLTFFKHKVKLSWLHYFYSIISCEMIQFVTIVTSFFILFYFKIEFFASCNFVQFHKCHFWLMLFLIFKIWIFFIKVFFVSLREFLIFFIDLSYNISSDLIRFSMIFFSNFQCLIFFESIRFLRCFLNFRRK